MLGLGIYSQVHGSIDYASNFGNLNWDEHAQFWMGMAGAAGKLLGLAANS